MQEGFNSKKENKTKINFDGIKKALLASIILLSSMQEAKSQNIPVGYRISGKPEIETVTEESKPLSDAKNLETGFYNLGDSIEIKIDNHYETDKPDISEDRAERISATVFAYLSSLNKSNIKDFLGDEIILRVSCDPRHTNFTGPDGKAGNKELAEARANTALSVIKESLNDFSNSNLSPEEIAQIKEKFNHIKVEIPLTLTETGRGEDGVEDYHNVINPETNKLFTDSEWTELQKPENEAKLLEAYKNFRYATLVLITLNEHEKVKVPGGHFDIEGYDKVQILFDDSPSMAESRVELANELENLKTKNDIPIQISGFTSKIDANFFAKNTKEAAELLKNIKLVDDDVEYAVKEVLTELENIPQTDNENQKKKIIVCTDEELQGVSREMIDSVNTLSKQKNVTIEFLLKQKEWNPKTRQEEPQIHKLSMSDIDTAYQKKYQNAKISETVENMKYQIKITNKELDEKHAELGKANNQKDIKRIMKEISGLNDDLTRLNNILINSQTVSLNDFK